MESEKSAETQTQHGGEGVTQPPSISIKNRWLCDTPKEDDFKENDMPPETDKNSEFSGQDSQSEPTVSGQGCQYDTHDTSPNVLEQSPNRSNRDDILPKEDITRKVITILKRDGESLDWDIANELDQPSAAINQVLSEVAYISCKRMMGNVYRLNSELLDSA